MALFAGMTLCATRQPRTLRADFRERHVVGIAADRIGMSLRGHFVLSSFHDVGASGGECLLRIGAQNQFVEVEQRVGDDRYLRRTWRALGFHRLNPLWR